MDILSLAATLPQNRGHERTYNTVELDGEGAVCVRVPDADSCYTQHLAGKRGNTAQMHSYNLH